MWGHEALDPDNPIRLEIFPGAEQPEWKAAARALRLCIERAGSIGLQLTWWELNQMTFRGRSPALANWIGEVVPRLEDADGVGEPGGAVDVSSGDAPSAALQQGGLRA
jgi:hypothetical protein